jgi:hypothetical protein
LKLLVWGMEMMQKLQEIVQDLAEGMVQEMLLPAWEVAHPREQEMSD